MFGTVPILLPIYLALIKLPSCSLHPKYETCSPHLGVLHLQSFHSFATSFEPGPGSFLFFSATLSLLSFSSTVFRFPLPSFPDFLLRNLPLFSLSLGASTVVVFVQQSSKSEIRIRAPPTPRHEALEGSPPCDEPSLMASGSSVAHILRYRAGRLRVRLRHNVR